MPDEHAGRARAGVRAAPLGGGPGPSPQLVMKRQRWLSGIEKIVLSLTATAELSANLVRRERSARYGRVST
jgi:hypothetical protein